MLFISAIVEITPDPHVKPKKKPRKFHQTYEWFKARQACLKLQRDTHGIDYNFCEECKVRSIDKRWGIFVAIEVDHKEPVSKRIDLALEPSNHWCLCMPCNRSKGVGRGLALGQQ